MRKLKLAGKSLRWVAVAILIMVLIGGSIAVYASDDDDPIPGINHDNGDNGNDNGNEFVS